jgi:hypothetical protein
MAPQPRSRRRRRSTRPAAAIAVLASSVIALTSSGLLAPALAASPTKTKITTVSKDPYKNTTAYHQTELEPDNYAWGKTIVAVFQTGRFTDGGSDNTGYATSTDGGKTWIHGFMPGTTPYSDPTGPYQRVSDPVIAYDAKHKVWIANSLTVGGASALIVNRSTDGGVTFAKPVVVDPAGGGASFDKNWIVCDNWKNSPHYGNCYIEADDNGRGNLIAMWRSTDGGKSWTRATVPSGSGLGGLPVVQPDGGIVVPYSQNFGGLASYVSTDGGENYSGPFQITNQTDHSPTSMRSDPIPSAGVDANGTVYLVWQDCRFRTGCPANDIVMTTSKNGKDWTDVVRIPIDAVGSGVDHFIPGLAVDNSTKGKSVKLALTYYYFPDAGCSFADCRLFAGFVSSTDTGKTWTKPKKVLGPIKLEWLPDARGRFVGDYISTALVGKKAFPVIANAQKSDCTLGQIKSCKEHMVAPTKGLKVKSGSLAVTADPVVVDAWNAAVPGASLH